MKPIFGTLRAVAILALAARTLAAEPAGPVTIEAAPPASVAPAQPVVLPGAAAAPAQPAVLPGAAAAPAKTAARPPKMTSTALLLALKDNPAMDLSPVSDTLLETTLKRTRNKAYAGVKPQLEAELKRRAEAAPATAPVTNAAAPATNAAAAARPGPPARPARAPRPAGIETNAIALGQAGVRFQLPPLTTEAGLKSLEGDAVVVVPARKNLYEGLILVQDADYSNAIPVLEKALAEDPALLSGWEALGWSYWNLGEKEKAEQTWVRLQKLAPGNPLSYNLLAQVYTSRKELEPAESMLKKSLELDPKQFGTRLHMGLIMAWQSRTEESFALFKALVKEEPDRIDVRTELAHAAFQLKDYEEASAQWQVVCEVVPDNADYLIEWARCLLYMGEMDAAEEKARRAADLDGGSLRALNVLADIAEISNRPENAILTIRKLLDRTDVPLTRSRIRARLVNLMRVLYGRNPELVSLDDIILESKAAIRDDPRNVNMMLFLAEIYTMDRRYDEALEILLEVTGHINPLNYRARRSLFEIYLVQREFDKALDIYNTIYDSPNADSAYRFADLARLEYAKGNYAEAIRLLDRMELEAMKGCVLTLAYSDLAHSDWEPGLPVRLFREHILFLHRAGFRFITPEETLPYLESRKPPSIPPPAPAPYRFIRWLRYAFAATPLPAQPTEEIDNYRPDRVVCITFDGALRNAFANATPIAEEFDVPFAMHVPVGNIVRREFGIASWDAIARYRETGRWSIGSQGLDAAVQVPGYEDGYRVSPLPNRLWLEDKKRVESLREWSLRVKDELKESRAFIVKTLGLDPTNDCRSIAYPFSEIGQIERSTIENLGDVPVRIINEASMVYRLGYIRSLFGYASADNNPLVHSRHEPATTASGQDVLEHALENHPVMMARKMKAELAALQGKTHMAYQMLDLLDRDGYPAESLRELRDSVERRISGRIARTDLNQSRGKSDSLVHLSRPYVGVDGMLNKANRQIEVAEYGFRGGLNLSPPLQAEGWYKWGRIDQDVNSNEVVMVTQQRISRSEVNVTGVDNGVPINKRQRTTTIQTEQVESNRVTKLNFDAEYTFAGGRLTYRIKDGSLLEGRFGVKDFDGEEEQGSEFVGGLTHVWKPAVSLDVNSGYAHDLVPSGRRIIESDSVGVQALWRARDWWDLAARGWYFNYSDENAMLTVSAESMWLVAEQQNIYAGIQYELTTVENDSEDYWSPYWEERISLALRMHRAFPAFFANAEAKVGMVREEGRPEDLEKWNALAVQGEAQEFYPGDKPGEDWDASVGLSGSLRRMLGRHLELEARAGTSFYSEYSEYTIAGTLLYHF